MSLRKWTRYCWPLLPALVLCCIALPALAYQLPFNGFPKIELSGNNTVSFNLHEVSGSQTYYNEDNFDKQDAFSHSSNLYLTGELFRDLHFNANIASSRFMPGNTSWNLRYDGGSAKVLLGEFSANLPGNEYVLFNRFLLGAQVDPVLKRGNVTLLASKLKSPVHTESFYGDNISGPYYLTNAPIIDSSEIVTINDERKTRMKDYTLDYTNGIIYFDSSIIVSPNDHVVVSYQIASGSGNGTLSAVRAAYPIMPNLNVGVSHLRLDAKNTGQSVKNREESYTSGAPQEPYQLHYAPIVPNSDIVKVNGAFMMRGTDYTIKYQQRSFTFNPGHEPLPGSTVTVYYQTTVEATEGGNRSVTGIDMDWQVRRGLRINVQTAKSVGGSTLVTEPHLYESEQHPISIAQPLTSQTFHLKHYPIKAGTISARVGYDTTLESSDFTVDLQTGELRVTNGTILVTPITGTILTVSYMSEGSTVVLKGDSALTMSTSYDVNRLAATLRFRQVDPGFAPLEMVGFRNTRQALDWTASYKITDWLRFNMTGDNTQLPNNPYGQTSAHEILMDEHNRSYSLAFTMKNWPQLTLRRNSRNSQQVNNGVLHRNSTTDSLNCSWNRNGFSASFDLYHAASDSTQYQLGTEESDPDAPVFSFKGDTLNGALRLGYNPGGRLNLDMVLAANKVKPASETAEPTTGRNMQANAQYRFTDNFSMNASLTNSETGATKTATGGEVSSLQSRNFNLGADWQLNEKLALSAAATADYYEGGDYSNNEAQTLSLNANWQANKLLTLNGYWFGQNLQYLDSTDPSYTYMVGSSATVTGWGKLGFKVDAQRIWGTNNSGVQYMYRRNGAARRAYLPISTDYRADTPITGTDTTTITTKVTYKIARQQELYVSGENTQNSGSSNASEKNAYGLGWNYLFSNNLTLTLDTQRLIFTSENSELNYNANQLNAQVSWQF